MKRLVALFAALVVTVTGAQTVQTTPNLITSGTGHTWYGVTTGTLPANYMPGGPTPIYDPATNTVTFSYNANASVGQTLAVNQALANAGAGVKINGYNYSYDIRNMNGDNRQGGTDTITVSQLLRGPNNSVLLSSSQYYNTKFEWQTITGTKTATTPYSIADTSYIQFGATGGDNGYWGGYFGPQIRNVSMKLNYSIDPCVSNPAYSPSCANYNTVQTSSNILSTVVGQSYAINQALGLSGSNVMIHAFNYGYDYNIGGRYCSGINFLGCWGWSDSNATVNVSLTDSNNSSLYSNSHYHSGENISGSPSYRYLFPTSRNLSTLGNVSFSASTTGIASISNVWSSFEYTPDPCTVNPLSSTTCPGYQQAYHDQQCTVNPLYASDCPGYTAAYLTQQCNANPLYSQSCPGYAQALFTQQCTNNPLSDTTCPGYAQAYHDQQCSINSLYANDCPGYQQAYLTQQCNISPLYSNQCTGYAVAYHDQQCGLSALYMSDCPGYQQAYFNQQCTANTLYDSQCPGYAVAYKNQQCGISALYATDCPGYAVAYHDSQCAANPLYMSDCPGYQVAYKAQQCGISALYATDCPGYAQAYFNQQCQLNGLYDRSCTNYSTAYAAKQLLDTPKTTAVTSTVVISTESTATVTSNPAAAAISDPIVSSAVSTPSTTSATSPTSITSVISSPSAATSPAAVAATTPAPAPAPSAQTKAEAKKTEGAVAKAAARGNAAAAAKEAAKEAANATSIEAQVATQSLVVGLMGYVPGFNAYQNAIVPDTLANAVARQYHKPTVDNRNAQRRLTGASDARWQEMVDSQYKLGN